MNLLLIITVAVLGFAAVAGLGFVFAGPTENDKVAHFLTTTSLERDSLPRLVFGDPPNVTVRHFPDKLPIGVQPYAHPHVLTYLVTMVAPRGILIARAGPMATIRS